ncbi:FG-GAP-like repeat-containing protein [Luteibacter sp. PPL552]
MQDSFDRLDTGHWSYWTGNIVQGGAPTYTFLPSNVFVSAGSLVMRATRDVSRTPAYQSGGIYHARLFKYGRFSARVRMTGTQGMIPALWLVGYAPSCGEIDIFEAGGLASYDPRKVHSQHYYYDDPSNCSSARGQVGITSSEWTGTDDYSASFHIFSMQWSPTEITYSVDGSQKFSSSYRVPGVAMRLNMETNLEPVAQSGIGNIISSASAFPSDFLVDWVKVEQWAPPACGATGDQTGNLRNAEGQCARSLAASFNGDVNGDAVLYNPSTGAAAVALGSPAPSGMTVIPLSSSWAAGSKVMTGDFNGDGFSDVAVYGSDGSLTLYYGQGDGSLRLSSAGVDRWNPGQHLFSGDFNGDGLSDLLVYDDETGAVEIRYGQSADGLRFAPSSQGYWVPGETIAIGDFNGDRRDDVFLYSATGAVAIVYGQDADGLRAAPASESTFSLGWQVHVGDFDGDNRADLLLYNPSTGDVEIRYGQDADGLRFAPGTRTTWNTGHVLRVGDFNGDGADDVLIYGLDGSSEIRYGMTHQDGLRFAPMSQVAWSQGHRLSVGDFDGDGRSDVLIQSTDNSVEIRYGQPSDGLRFAPSTQTRWNAGWTIISGRQ